MQEYSKKSLLIMDILLSAFLVALDQLTKMQAVRLLMGKPAIQLIPGVLEFCYLENTGAAFSILRNARWFFVILTSRLIVSTIDKIVNIC